MKEEYFESLYPDTVHAGSFVTLASFLSEGNSCQVLGVPGVGRSTFLNILAYNAGVKKKYFPKTKFSSHFVLANFSEVRNRSLFDVFKFLFLNLTESLRERKMTEEHAVVGDIFREHLSFHDELILFQGFKEAIEYLTVTKKIRVIFLFDRFEEYIPTVTSEFFANIRALRNKGKHRFSVVFSVYRPLETQLEPALLADFYEFIAGNILYLPLYDKPTLDFRIASLEKITKKHIPSPVLSEIITLSGGVGRLVKFGAEAYLARGEGISDFAPFLLKQPLVKKALLEIWFSLSPAEQSDILQKTFDDSSVDSYLEHMGLIANKQIQIPLLERLVQEEVSVATSETQGIVYDEHTNTIKKGEDILSDQLTASEFRLLRYLLQNPERVIERDELIRVVWSGMKSTAGITDQAIDQLIFRLRRKIETDANNPVHVVTIKGRGFKFVA